MASDPPGSSRAQQPHAGPQPAPIPAPGDAASPPSKASLKQWWRNFSKPPNKGQENVSNVQQPTGIFGVPLRQSITYANVAISLVDGEGRSYIYGYVPIVVAKCGVFLKEKATNVEGIFRLSGSEKRIKELRTQFDSPDRYGKGLDWAGYTVHDAANVLRRYLNQLPEPIVPLELYEKFREPLRGHTQEAVGDAEGPQLAADFDVAKAISTYQKLITDLPPLNRQLLLYILDLLAVFASKSDENRMPSANLAAIFQPGMLSHPQHDMAPEEYRLSQDVLIFLIENQDHFLIGMRGTAADEQTVYEVQNGGTPPPGTPNTPGRKTNVARSASNASAGADSVRKYGGIRRNVSVSSRHSRQSNGAPSPASPAYGAPLTNTTSSGVHRSNTVPSKRSPGLPGNRLQKTSGSPSPTATAFNPAQAAAPRGLSPAGVTIEDRSFTSSSPGATPTALGISATSAASAITSQERLLAEPGNAATPARERNISNLFQRSPTAETDRKAPKKLQKKRGAPGSANPSAQSSTQSLHSQSHLASPPLNAARGTGDVTESSPLEPIPSSSEPPAIEQTEATPPATTTPRADQTAHQFPTRPEGMHQPSERTLKPASPPTSLHSSSSFNDQSDADRHDDTVVANEPKEKRRLFRMSRHRDTSGPSLTPRKGLGSDAGAGASSTSVGSAKPRKSWTGETMPASSDSTLVGAHLHSSNDTDHGEEKKGPLSRLWEKVRENKEERDAKKERNKSPPGSNERLASALPRGKSMDVRRDEHFEMPLEGSSTPRAQQPPPPR
ncbi:RhoGAP-domain-containing protein [Mollisia scopiformis]|uniref:RhoGAP-domain-containing protein n=1 Tax=Mollisia scopiformis TaxID=149040 RepID=A0A194X5C2_MOLSC|nr:RhoGAP-domain-containing protein [Mollisia scopiformis]KUJ15388.1 RhoGAP-domain-containing protein [Mollisia scopiformis]